MTLNTRASVTEALPVSMRSTVKWVSGTQEIARWTMLSAWGQLLWYLPVSYQVMSVASGMS